MTFADKDMSDRPPKKAKKSISDDVVERRLKNKALHYLGRYSSTRARLRATLERFAQRKLGDVPKDTLNRAIIHVIEYCQTLGYVSDDAFVASHIRQGYRSGQSQTMITAKLRAAGIESDLVTAGFKQAQEQSSRDELELLSALKFALRRRLGCFSVADIDPSSKQAEKQLAQLARRGFSYDICRKVLDMHNRQDAEIMLQQLEEKLN